MNPIPQWAIGIAIGIALIEAGAIQATPETAFVIAIGAVLLTMALELISIVDSEI